jgi:hypothetical protein
MKIRPFVTSCEDVHELDDIVRHFINAGIYNLKYTEIGLGISKYSEVDITGIMPCFIKTKEKQKT